MPESDKLTLEITQALIQKREYFALKETLATSLAPDIVEIIQFLDISDRVILFPISLKSYSFLTSLIGSFSLDYSIKKQLQKFFPSSNTRIRRSFWGISAWTGSRRSSKRWTRTISPGSSMNFPMKW
jgi:hypothetical protein